MSPEEDRTRDAVDSEPKHYQLSYSGPREWLFNLILMQIYVRVLTYSVYRFRILSKVVCTSVLF